MRARLGAAVAAAVFLASGCGGGPSSAAVQPTPVAIPAQAATRVPAPVSAQGEPWDLTTTIRAVAGDPCGTYAGRVGSSIDWSMAVERTNASVRLLYDVRNWPTDHVEYVSALNGDAFEATSRDGFGFPQDCGGRHYAWRGSGYVAGAFSSDGRSVSGREEWNYATASGDELRLFLDWSGTRR